MLSHFFKQWIVYIDNILEFFRSKAPIIVMCQLISDTQHLHPLIIVNDFINKCLLKSFSWGTDCKVKNTVGSDILLTMECNGGNLVCGVYAKDNINVGNVSVDIKKSGDKYTLTRYVNGKQNYKTVSKYREAKK